MAPLPCLEKPDTRTTTKTGCDTGNQTGKHAGRHGHMEYTDEKRLKLKKHYNQNQLTAGFFLPESSYSAQ